MSPFHRAQLRILALVIGAWAVALALVLMGAMMAALAW